MRNEVCMVLNFLNFPPLPSVQPKPCLLLFCFVKDHSTAYRPYFSALHSAKNVAIFLAESSPCRTVIVPLASIVMAAWLSALCLLWGFREGGKEG